MRRKRGFTLIEILVSLAILVVGIVGILVLFPAGLHSTKIAIEDTYAATIAESLYNSLRIAAQRIAPGDPLVFAHDGIASGGGLNSFVLPDRPSGTNAGNALSIPAAVNNFTVEIDSNAANGDEYFLAIVDLVNGKPIPKAAHFAQLAVDGDGAFQTNLGGDPNRWNKYSYNIQITYPRDTSPRLTPTGLFDVTIRVYRVNELVKKFHTKMFIPTDDP